MVRHLILLVTKDLKRTWRNPTPVLIQIAIPFLITALIGMAFGGAASDDEGIEPLRIAIVDQDEALFTQMLASALGQEEFKEHIDARFMGMDEALSALQDKGLNAVMVIPQDFTNRLIDGEDVTFELIKNP